MGPHSFKCGSLISATWNSPILTLLQWGRTLSSAEVVVPLAMTPDMRGASMGPHSFKCGSFKPEAWRSIEVHSLQWGRTLSSAEVGRTSHLKDYTR